MVRAADLVLFDLVVGVQRVNMGPMRLRLAIIILLWMLPRPLAAQTTTDDGVRAFGRLIAEIAWRQPGARVTSGTRYT
jgi:hypothetical protein